MDFNQMLQNDLDACTEVKIKISHTYSLGDENLLVVFDNFSTVVFQKGENAGLEALAPSFTISTHEAGNISHRSTFVIDGGSYAVLEIQKNADLTSRVVLEKIQ